MGNNRKLIHNEEMFALKSFLVRFAKKGSRFVVTSMSRQWEVRSLKCNGRRHFAREVPKVCVVNTLF